MKQPVKIISWALRIISALILLQTLFFKFTAAPESVYIFTTVGMEPYGRIGTGVGELIAAVLLLVPATCSIGALLGFGLMSGAIFFHLTKLGLVVKDDGGLLFAYCLIVWLSSAIVVALHSKDLFDFIRKFTNSKSPQQ